MKIIIYSQNLVSMDGVGNSTLYFQNLLKSFGDTELVAHYSNINGVTNFDEYIKKHNSENILFYHYSIEDIKLNLLLELNFKRRIIYYHGITPPKFFPQSSELFNSCKKGLSNINDLLDFDLYIANSTESKNQFIRAITKNFIASKNFIIMPPINLFLEKKADYKKKSLRSEFNFYYCGTLSKHKNVSCLLDLFIKNAKDNQKLSIFTSFSKEDSHNNLGENRYNVSLKNGIKFFHKLSDQEINKNILNMNCFITLSLHEGFCIPLFNAIDNFNPVLSFPLKCLQDYFPKEYKYISNIDDFKDINNKYHYNLEHIHQFRNFIKDKANGFTNSGLDLIKNTIK